MVDSVSGAWVRGKFEMLGVGGTWQPHPEPGLFRLDEITAAGRAGPGPWSAGGARGGLAGRRGLGMSSVATVRACHRPLLADRHAVHEGAADGQPAKQERLFREIPWSTADVLSETIRRAEAEGLRVECLPPWFDVDTPGDLARLSASIAETDGEASAHTRRFFVGAGAMKKRRPSLREDGPAAKPGTAPELTPL